MKMTLVAAFVLFLANPLFAQADPTSRSWNQPVEPFRIAGNIYYVGASDVTSYLITTPRGHVLLDSGFVETVPLIVANVAKLGFDIKDVKVLLISHAHYDHVGGMAELRRLTGAALYVMKEDIAPMARGGLDDFGFENRFPFEKVEADHLLADRQVVSFGGMRMVAHKTPGHTRGCTTWTTRVTEKGKKLDVVFVGSASVPGYRLVNNERYPEIISDYEKTFARLRSLRCDVFLAAHGNFYALKDKMNLLETSLKNPFLDPEGYRAYIDRAENAFRKQVAAETVP